MYLLPEIALTTQIIKRLQKHFGDKVGITHSHLNNGERVEVWKAVQEMDKRKNTIPRLCWVLGQHYFYLLII